MVPAILLGSQRSVAPLAGFGVWHYATAFAGDGGAAVGVKQRQKPKGNGVPGAGGGEVRVRPLQCRQKVIISISFL